MNSGRLEVLHNNEYGTVCDDYFEEPDVRVVCAQLGYYAGRSFRLFSTMYTQKTSLCSN